MFNLHNIRDAIQEWISPRYTRLRLQVDPVTKQITAETEEEPPPAKNYKPLFYIGLVGTSVIIVFILLYIQSQHVKRAVDTTQQQMALVDNQNRKLLEQARRRSDIMERQARFTKDQLMSMQEQSQEQLTQSKQEIDQLQRHLNALQRENDDLRRKMSKISENASASSSTAPKKPSKPLEVMYSSQ